MANASRANLDGMPPQAQASALPVRLGSTTVTAIALPSAYIARMGRFSLQQARRLVLRAILVRSATPRTRAACRAKQGSLPISQQMHAKTARKAKQIPTATLALRVKSALLAHIHPILQDRERASHAALDHIMSAPRDVTLVQLVNFPQTQMLHVRPAPAAKYRHCQCKIVARIVRQLKYQTLRTPNAFGATQAPSSIKHLLDACPVPLGRQTWIKVLLPSALIATRGSFQEPQPCSALGLVPRAASRRATNHALIARRAR